MYIYYLVVKIPKYCIKIKTIIHLGEPQKKSSFLIGPATKAFSLRLSGHLFPYIKKKKFLSGTPV